MRHQYTKRMAVALTALFVLAALVFAVAEIGRSDERVEVILGLDADVDAGERLYLHDTEPTCASCHNLEGAGVTDATGPDLDDIDPTRREVVNSIVGGHIGAHEAQDYRIELSDREVADIAAFVDEALASR